MTQDNKYSADLYAIFNSTPSEPVVEGTNSGIMKPKTKQEPAKAGYDPMGFLSDFGSTLKGFFSEDEIKTLDNLPSPPAVRTEVLNQYHEGASIDTLTRSSADTVSALREAQGITSAEGSLGGILAKQRTLLEETGTTPVAETPVEEQEEAPIIDTAVIEAAVANIFGSDAEEAPAESAEGAGLMSRGPTKRAKRVTEGRTTDAFYLDIGTKAESDHGSTPVITKDAREADLPDAQKTRDIGFGHKITAAENTSGKIHGVTFKKEDGTYIPLNAVQKRTILKADMKLHQDSARSAGWDTKLTNIGTSWDKLEAPYQNALTSLAYNVGGSKAGRTWTNVLTAAKNEDVSAFAQGLRRKDAGKNTAGMDNRVAKELYFAGLIDSLADISSELPLADARSGVPATAEATD